MCIISFHPLNTRYEVERLNYFHFTDEETGVACSSNLLRIALSSELMPRTHNALSPP